MIQITPQMRILLAVEPVDFRRGIDGLACLCREALKADPFSGTAFVFRNRRGAALRVLVYDGQGMWLCHKRCPRAGFAGGPLPAGTPPVHSMRTSSSSLCGTVTRSVRAQRRCGGQWRREPEGKAPRKKGEKP